MKKKVKEGEEIFPLVVCDEGGAFLFLSSTNPKGYRKSIEQNALWVVQPETDRLLPSGKEAALRVLEDRGGYYYAEVSVSGSMEFIEPSGSEASGGKNITEAPAPSQPVTADPKILADLAELVSRRRQEMPEGSYTTLLFNSGIDKIRKKTGEEAVELILARSDGDVVGEAADLVYHLIVLLEAQGTGLNPVLEELSRRAK